MPLVILRPTTALHVGQGVGVERQKIYGYVPSDTLFAALMVAWAQLGQAEAMMQSFATDPAFTLTSVFPCLLTKAEKPEALLHLLPVPLVKLPGDVVLEAKQKKRLRWVSWGIFDRLRRAQAVDDEATEDNLLQHGAVWLLKSERDAVSQAWGREADSFAWWSQAVVPRVAIDRVTSASNLYHAGRISFAQSIGLWFAVRVREAASETKLKAALDVLSDAGLGGLRSTGHGAFQYAWQAASFLPETAGTETVRWTVTLARYAPKDAAEVAQTLQPRGASYQVTTIAGWCEDDTLSPYRRKRVKMVTEGSVIDQSGQMGQTPGQLVNVTPTGAPQAKFGARGVYRYGYAFPIGVSTAALREAMDG